MLRLNLHQYFYFLLLSIHLFSVIEAEFLKFPVTVAVISPGHKVALVLLLPLNTQNILSLASDSRTLMI